MQKTRVLFLGQEDPLEKEMATHSTILAGESHGQRSLAWDSVPSVARVGHNLVTKTPESPHTADKLNGNYFCRPTLLPQPRKKQKMTENTRITDLLWSINKKIKKRMWLLKASQQVTYRIIVTFEHFQIQGLCVNDPSKLSFEKNNSRFFMFYSSFLKIIFPKRH